MKTHLVPPLKRESIILILVIKVMDKMTTDLRSLSENYLKRIVQDPEILSGKPVIAGTRISVELILEKLAAGWSISEILENYPELTIEDIRAALYFAKKVLEKLYEVK